MKDPVGSLKSSGNGSGCIFLQVFPAHDRYRLKRCFMNLDMQIEMHVWHIWLTSCQCCCCDGHSNGFATCRNSVILTHWGRMVSCLMTTWPVIFLLNPWSWMWPWWSSVLVANQGYATFVQDAQHTSGTAYGLDNYSKEWYASLCLRLVRIPVITFRMLSCSELRSLQTKVYRKAQLQLILCTRGRSL